MSETIIVAPHPDDEIIGCYEKLMDDENVIVIYDPGTDSIRREEAMKLKDELDNIKVQLFLANIPPNLLTTENTFYFPDPVYETHPLHRMYGSMGENIARGGFDVVFYNTNMLAPYIHESKNPGPKENLLETVYPLQKELWKYEKKYVLFEGYCKWIF